MRLPKMTTRRWMVVVAIVALIAGVGIEADRLVSLSKLFRARTAEAAAGEQELRTYGASLRDSLAEWLYRTEPNEQEFKKLSSARTMRGLSSGEEARLQLVIGFLKSNKSVADDFQRLIATNDARVEHFARLRQKYDHAARRPWLSIEPDSPEPRTAPK